MTYNYKCPICGKINDLNKEVQVYRCSACTRRVRAHAIDIEDQAVETPPVAEVISKKKRKVNARKTIQD
jgi:DNA-directed RNA polymerase subunit RPC12/RpoP